MPTFKSARRARLQYAYDFGFIDQTARLACPWIVMGGLGIVTAGRLDRARAYAVIAALGLLVAALPHQVERPGDEPRDRRDWSHTGMRHAGPHPR